MSEYFQILYLQNFECQFFAKILYIRNLLATLQDLYFFTDSNVLMLARTFFTFWRNKAISFQLRCAYRFTDIIIIMRPYTPKPYKSTDQEISRFRHLYAFGFQSKLASLGFPRVLRFSLLHLKLRFFHKSVPCVWRRP